MMLFPLININTIVSNLINIYQQAWPQASRHSVNLITLVAATELTCKIQKKKKKKKRKKNYF